MRRRIRGSRIRRRTIETAAWPRDHLDLGRPAFLRIDGDGAGETAFGAPTAPLDGGSTASGVDFNWNGSDKGDQVTGKRRADLRNDGRLKGGVAHDNGGDTTLIAEPWRCSAACLRCSLIDTFSSKV